MDNVLKFLEEYWMIIFLVVIVSSSIFKLVSIFVSGWKKFVTGFTILTIFSSPIVIDMMISNKILDATIVDNIGLGACLFIVFLLLIPPLIL